MKLLNPTTWFGSTSPAIEEKRSEAASIVMPWNVGQAVWTPRNYEHLTREAYQLNSVGFRCCKMISVCATTPRWLLFDKSGNEIEQHPLLDLLARPAMNIGSRFFFESLYTYLLLAGNSYIEAVGPKSQPTELWALRPDRMKVIAGPYAQPSSYQYEVDGRKKVWPVNPLTGDSQILHMREFHPLNDWYGLSRVEPASYGIDRHNAASKHNKALLDNGARPSGALIFKPLKVPGADGVMNAPADVIEKAQESLNKRHGGPANAGKPMVLGGDVDWIDMGISPKDMDFDESKQDAARDMCNAWGVPPILVVKGQSTYNNVREAKLELYEDTVIPLVEHVTSCLNAWLTPRFGDGLRLAPDLDSVSALEPRRESKRTSVTTLLEKGVLDEDEAREELGYGPRGASVVRKVDAAVLTALVATIDTVGMHPLFRYMKSVGLFDPIMTEEEALQAALDLVGDDDEQDDDQTLNGDQEDDQDDV